MSVTPIRPYAWKSGADHAPLPDAHGQRPADDLVLDLCQRLPVGVAVFDAGDRLVFANDACRAFFPALQDLLVCGTPFIVLAEAEIRRGCVVVRPEELDAHLEWRLTTYRHPKHAMTLELCGGRSVRVEYSPLGEGACMAVFTDVTLLKDREDALNQRVRELEDLQNRLEAQGRELAELAAGLAAMRDKAELASRTKSDFLANMSHELRSPLNAIIGFAEIMRDELLGPIGTAQYKEYTQDILAGGQHLLSLINDILDLSKVEAGRLELREETVDLDAALDACVRLTATRAQKGDVTISAETHPSARLIHADERKIKQILINLLSNAVKFTKPGGRVSVTAGLDAEGRPIIKVADTGIGIAPQDISKAMAAFGQIDSKLSRQHEGTGLGLPLTKSLVELHGGTLDLVSEVDVGTTVTITLPADRVRS